MREILFRGKAKDGKWYFGDLVQFKSGLVYIQSKEENASNYVIPETVGQFTGLTDKNGKKLFEGDIVRVDKDGDILEIMYCERGYFCANNNAWWEFIDELGAFEVIGNIHDNPELLEVAE